MKNSFYLAMMFLTRLPVPRLENLSDSDHGGALRFYPLVGCLVGLILAAAFALMPASLPLLSCALIIMLWVFITGGLHIDGLADSADAWLGGLGDKARSLEIMKDPRVGSAAVMTVVCVLLVKFAALASLAPSVALIALVLVPTLARCVPACLFLTTPYARAEGSASVLLKHLQPRAIIAVIALVFILTGAILYPLLGWLSLIFFALLAMQLWCLRALMLARIDGVTGDTVGASVEITEMCSLVLLNLLIA